MGDKKRRDTDNSGTYEPLCGETNNPPDCTSDDVPQDAIRNVLAVGTDHVCAILGSSVQCWDNSQQLVDVPQKVTAGVPVDIAIVNTYYLAGMINSTDSTEVAAAEKVDVFWPNQNDRGTHINISGAGVTKHAKNTESAVQLMEFLITLHLLQKFSLSLMFIHLIGPLGL